ncbi:hypothetical protein O3M35_012205 [Rhynocoris fuscipes]|uniref:Uncharacterized protein n=1 Tax=Rhynocoris fuscipes TaxID=488301 RepID=A0AAW1CVJ0_9HEMI
MNTLFCLLALVAFSSAAVILAEDDGQWHPELDGSALGSGQLQWGRAIAAPAIISTTGILGSPLIAAIRRKRSAVIAAPLAAAGIINPNALNVPLDEITVAAAKNAQLVQQATEGTRNILGGGIPLALPADTPEVAIGKAAHAIATERQKLAVASGIIAPGLLASRTILL